MRPPSLKPLLAVTTLATLAAWRVARLMAGAIGLQHEFGLAWAGIGVTCLVLLRFATPIRIGALLAAVSLWHWPWLAALWISTLLAALTDTRPDIVKLAGGVLALAAAVNPQSAAAQLSIVQPADPGEYET